MIQSVKEFLAEWTAAEQAADTAKLERLLDGGFTAVGPLGFILPKEAWLARHRSGDLVYDAFGLDEVQVRPLGQAAVVVARHDARGRFQGHPIPEAVRATLTLVTGEEGWKLAAIHLSFIAGTPGSPPIPGMGNVPGGAQRAG